MRQYAVIPLILAAAILPMRGKAQSQIPPVPMTRSTLTVEGNGQAQAKPDFSRITAAVSAKGASLDAAVAAQQEPLARANALLRDLAAEGVEIERSTFSLANDRPPYPPRPDTNQGPPSFTAATSFALKATRIDRLNAIVAKLAASGVLELRSVSFEVADTHPPLDEARRNAVAEARHKAETLAEAAGVRLDEVVSITDANVTPRVYAAAAETAAAAPSQLVIPPATLTFNASVTMGWRISPKP